MARARAGGGPTFIEAPVYRFRAHGGAGDDSRTGYRDEAERASVGGRRSARICSREYPDCRPACSTLDDGRRRWSATSPPRSPRRSSTRSPARTRPKPICTGMFYADAETMTPNAVG